MAKVTRPRMARGTKLVLQHLTNSVGAAATLLGTAAVERTNLHSQWGVARLTYHVPVLDSNFFVDATNGRTLFCIPFTIIPFQDKFSNVGRFTDLTDAPFILDEFGLSFDQRREPASICDVFQNPGAPANVGKLNLQGVGGYDLRISIDEKEQTFFNANAPAAPQVNVLSARLPAEKVAGAIYRDNPFLIGDLGKQVSPYRTYLLTLDAHKLRDNTGPTEFRSALASLTFTLKLRVPLVARDGLGVANSVQNMPSPSMGAKNPHAVSQNAIAGGDHILESNVQQNIVNVDAVFQRKLEGGYTQEGVAPPTEELADDSCWECVIIPVWQNFARHHVVLAQNAPQLPFVGAVPFKGRTEDRRRVPICFPWVLHHAVFCHNYMAPSGTGIAAAGTKPVSTHFTVEVGVGLLEAQRADDVAYQQIAYAKYTPVAGGAFPPTLIDTIVPHPQAQHLGWELVAVPLRGAGGNGYPAAQGKPIFIGRTNDIAAARSDVAGAAPFTQGCETIIEVRVSLQNSVDGLATFIDGGVEDATAVYMGYGGSFLMLIGKKSLCGSGRDVPA